ncbi:hypothetical protein QL093DRAFT_2520263 [Fusarium oxysporum]|nr:hypothetical protein QL093DRAFT_2520263 [Fusarium oxysporum]
MHLVEKIIELFGLDVVYVARIDLNLIESDGSDAVATVLVAYVARGAEIPRWISPAMYQRPNQGAK